MATDDQQAYDAWVAICDREQWNPQTQIVLLEGFIRQYLSMSDFASFAQRAAEHSRALEH